MAAEKGFSLVSMFAGAGGLDLGLERAGFRTVAAVDNDPDAIATLRTNQAAGVAFGDGRRHLDGAAILAARVESLEPADLRPAGRSSDWVPDLMAGGPPCQPVSSAGKMLSTDDPRGRLFEHFVRLADGLRPRTILFENVRGLVTAKGPSGEPGEVLRMVKDAFEAIGYATTFALLNAADYGSPQRRVRCFMLATRGTSLPAFPEPTHAERPAGGLFGTERPWRTLGEFLAACPPPAADEIVRPTPRLMALLRDMPDGSGVRSAGARETTRPGGHWGYRQGTFVAALDQPARTVTASASQDWIRTPDGGLRRLTLSECAGLQGFPAEWTFRGPAASRFRQVGNAVPAVFGEVLGQAIVEALHRGPRSRPQSAPLPTRFLAAVAYTKREHLRNGESRRDARNRIAIDGGSKAAKGLGSQDAEPSRSMKRPGTLSRSGLAESKSLDKPAPSVEAEP